MKTKLLSFIILLISFYQVKSQACFSGDISCFATRNVSIGPFCSIEITPEMVLSEICPERNYRVDLFDGFPAPGNMLPNPIDGRFIGTTIVAKVTDTDNDNFCTGEIILEDKSPPFIDLISAPINLSCRDNLEEVINIGVVDNCGASSFEISSIEYRCIPCQIDSVYITYELSDEFNNTAFETIGFEFVDFCFDAEFPEDVVFNCPPDLGDIPSITVNDSDRFCASDVAIDISDIKIGCDITRIYTVTEQCSGRSITHTQIIDVLQDDPPTLTVFPPDGPISLEEFNDGYIPEFEASSECGILVTVTDQIFKESLSCNPANFLVLYEISTTDVCGNSSPTEQVIVEVQAVDPSKVKIAGRNNCSGEFIVTADTRDMAEPISFTWSISGISPFWSITPIAGTNQARVRAGEGKATVRVTARDISGCVQTDTKKYNCRRNPFGRSNNEEIGIFPNPTSDNLNISLEDEIQQIQIYSMDGTLIQSFNNINNSFINIDMNQYSSGIYLFSIMTEDQTIVEKVVKD